MTSTVERNIKTTGHQDTHAVQAFTHAVLLGLCCLLSYKIITGLLAFSVSVPRADELLGGMWAVIATTFVFRYSYNESVRAALSRASATLFSFALCLVYLLIFPFRPWGLAVLIAIGAILLDFLGRSGDIITACITTAVVMVVAGISPEHAWKQPILRLIDTVVGIGVGIVGAWIARALTSLIRNQSPADLQQSHGEHVRS